MADGLSHRSGVFPYAGADDRTGGLLVAAGGTGEDAPGGLRVGPCHRAQYLAHRAVSAALLAGESQKNLARGVIVVIVFFRDLHQGSPGLLGVLVSCPSELIDRLLGILVEDLHNLLSGLRRGFRCRDRSRLGCARGSRLRSRFGRGFGCGFRGRVAAVATAAASGWNGGWGRQVSGNGHTECHCTAKWRRFAFGIILGSRDRDHGGSRPYGTESQACTGKLHCDDALVV